MAKQKQPSPRAKRRVTAGNESPAKKPTGKRPPTETADGIIPKEGSAAVQESAEGKGCFSVAGIGASAGGVDAFVQLFQSLRADTGLALVVVQHLAPTHRSRLAEVLGRATSMPVVDAIDGTMLERNNIYVIPANVDVTSAHGRLTLLPRDRAQKLRMPIDSFFQSLAAAYKENAIGVVLSGTASDATQGLKAIKAAGGVTIAQEPTSAKYDGMPRSAIAAGVVDFILTPAQIAGELAALGSHRRGFSVQPPEGSEPSDSQAATTLEKIFALLRRKTAVDLTHYKHSTIQRRIGRRLALHKLRNLDEYLVHLEAHPDEPQLLCEDIFIHVTEFFRDQGVFQALAKYVFPAITADREPGIPIRIWVAGCSTGEEVYSMAICLLEYLGEKADKPRIQIFGSDISREAIAVARAGIYPESSVQAKVGKDRLKRFFTPVDRGCRINKAVRDLCVFVKHDITRDPPFSKVDLISCRNLLIYFDASLQKKVLPLLHYALNQPGFLLLGGSETLAGQNTLFSVADQPSKLYAKKVSAARVGTFPVARATAQVDFPRKIPEVGRVGLEAQREADQLLLTRFAPPGVIVNDDLEILQFRGRTGAYLEPAPGHANLNLLKMAREGLLADLTKAIQTAKRDNVAVRRERAQVRGDGHSKAVNIEVLPIRRGHAEERHFLVLFEDSSVTQAAGSRSKGRRLPGQKVGSAAERVFQLEQELASTREHLQSVVDQHTAALDELTSTNEELVSSNEELQSSNEELETAKEELQSLNEELTTVNDELHNRNQELSIANNDLINVFASVDIPVVIVDSARNIRRFTPRARTVLNLIKTDVGRPIGDIKPKIDVPHLDAWIAEVIDSINPIESEVLDEEGRWYHLQIRPYKTLDQKIDGAVISLIDIDALKRSMALVKAAGDYALAIVETIPMPVVILDHALRVRSANPAFYELFRIVRAGAETTPIDSVGDGRWTLPSFLATLQGVLSTGKPFNHVEVEYDSPTMGRRTMLLTGCPLSLEIEGYPLLLLAIEDITERKQLEEHRAELRTAAEQHARAAERANREKDVFLAMVSHELRTPLNTIFLASEMMLRVTLTPENVRKSMERVARSARIQAQLIDDLLDISRMGSGKLTIQRQDADLAAIVHTSVDIVATDAAAKSIQFETQLDPSASSVWGDPKRLQQIVWNLLVNAIKFTPTGGKVEVRLDPVGEGVRLQVKDTGIGIRPELLPHIFEKFVQADSSSTRSHNGLGLGLAIVHHLVEQHGGTIQVESAGEETGTTFIVVLPARSTPVAASAPEADRRGSRRRRPHIAGEPDIRGLRVLVVEDDIATLQSVADVLHEYGCEVIKAASAAEALAAMERLEPDVLLSDIAMPGEDGYSLIGKVRALGPERGGLIPAAALTAHAEEAAKARVVAAGFQMHIAKPIGADALITVVTQLARSRQPP